MTHLDAIADAYVTTCYSTRPSGVLQIHLPACPSNSGSVLSASTYQSAVVAQQFHANGALCRQTTSRWLTQSTTGVVHHQEVRNRVTVPIVSACSSRKFTVKLFLRWVRGNPFFVETSPQTRVSIRPMSS